jgi:hypothetical protein
VFSADLSAAARCTLPLSSVTVGRIITDIQWTLIIHTHLHANIYTGCQFSNLEKKALMLKEFSSNNDMNMWQQSDL